MTPRISMAACSVVGLLSGCFSEPNAAGGGSTGRGSSTGADSQVGSSTAAAETTSGSTAAAETTSGSSEGASTGWGSSNGMSGDASSSETTTGGALECDVGFETPEVLMLATGRQEVSFTSEIGYTDVHLFVDQFAGARDPATAEFPRRPRGPVGEGRFTWTFPVVWPVPPEFLPGEAVVRFTGLDNGSEFITTCGVLLQ